MERIKYMIYGIGTDIVEIKRVKDAVERWGERFLKKIFTDEEISYCYKKKDPFPHLAVRFAAKEALIKAIGSEIPVSLTEIEIVNTFTGQPSIKVNGRIKRFFEEKSIRQTLLSLSHEKEYGIACVVLER